MKWKLVCFSSWSSKCYSGGLGPTPNWDVGCLREECYHNKAAQSRALNKRKAPREGWLSKYRNSYVPPRTWALGIKTHPDQEIAIITGHCPQNRNQSPSKYMHLIAAADSKNVRFLSHFRLRKWLPK